MPYRLNWESPHGVYRDYVGHVSVAERRASFDAICGDARFDDLLYAITDYGAVDTYEMTSAATAEIAALHVGPLFTNPRIVLAAVVTRPDIIGAIREFIALGYSKAPYEVFPTPDAARVWIASMHPGAIQLNGRLSNDGRGASHRLAHRRPGVMPDSPPPGCDQAE